MAHRSSSRWGLVYIRDIRCLKWGAKEKKETLVKRLWKLFIPYFSALISSIVIGIQPPLAIPSLAAYALPSPFASSPLLSSPSFESSSEWAHFLLHCGNFFSCFRHDSESLHLLVDHSNFHFHLIRKGLCCAVKDIVDWGSITSTPQATHRRFSSGM